MYIGSTGVAGLHHLIWEVVDNSIDEVMSGHASVTHVRLNADGSATVTDDGRGIPTGTHPETGRSALETVMTVLHAGGKFGGEGSGYKISGGLHGVGVSVVNALSDWVEVRVREGPGAPVRTMRFTDGVADGPLGTQPLDPELDAVPRFELAKDGGKSDNRTAAVTGVDPISTGTSVSFFPSGSIFKHPATGAPAIAFEADRLTSRMDELAYLNPGLTLSLTDARSEPGTSELFRHTGGLGEYAQLLCRSKAPLLGSGRENNVEKTKDLLTPDGTTILASGVSNSISCSLALRWSSDMYTESLLSFCNNIKTKDGGSHVDGMKTCLTRTVNNCARKAGKLKEGDSNIPGEFIREGLTAIVSVSVPEPEFEGQTKGRLGNPEVRPAVDAVLAKELNSLFDWRPDLLSKIVEKATAAQNAANAARLARDLVRRKTLLTSSVLPGKLADCQARDPDRAEIFIVEGDSAAGSAKQGRNRENQAILPLRGKILNIERAAAERIYANAELQALISALGLGIKNCDFDLSKLRYKKIIIMTDADVDGAHIRVLLLTFFYRYQRQLIEDGYVYCACPPLYKITSGKKVNYVYTEEEKLAHLESIGPEAAGRASLQRFKGLGEMMPQQLWETTMDPTVRTLKQVTIEDAAESDLVMSTLMGDSVAPRKDFITRNSESVAAGDLDF
ncbi:hypothetical protein TeGR_g13779 [Tetraparma gracilis]|nr:hypothetical protein TeGR_g13779 [Tetraparma gracilis]